MQQSLLIYTMPMATSTNSATITTNAEMINPWIMGRMPAFFRLEKEVFKPMAAKAQTMRNLLMDLVWDTTWVGMGNRLATIDMATKPKMNQGKILPMPPLPNAGRIWPPLR